jgi:hypothetical protein
MSKMPSELLAPPRAMHERNTSSRQSCGPPVFSGPRDRLSSEAGRFLTGHDDYSASVPAMSRGFGAYLNARRLPSATSRRLHDSGALDEHESHARTQTRLAHGRTAFIKCSTCHQSLPRTAGRRRAATRGHQRTWMYEGSLRSCRPSGVYL